MAKKYAKKLNAPQLSDAIRLVDCNQKFSKITKKNADEMERDPGSKKQFLKLTGIVKDDSFINSSKGDNEENQVKDSRSKSVAVVPVSVLPKPT